MQQEDQEPQEEPQGLEQEEVLLQEEAEGRQSRETWEETFQAQVRELKGPRQRKKPVRFEEEEERRPESPRLSPRERKRRQSLAKHGRKEQPEYIRLQSGQYMRKEALMGKGSD